MNKILVTGGAGFIGSHTCLSLLKKGYEVVIIDSFCNSSKISLKKVEEIICASNPNINYYLKVYEGDLKNINFVDYVFLEENCKGKPIDAVIHFAGLKSVKESVESPLIYWDENILSTINLLKVMDKKTCRTLVFSSSATIYGLSKRLLIKEENKIKPINPYGNTKATIELILCDLFKSNPNKWKISNLRYFNPIGAHESGLIGENPIGIPNNIFPFILEVASKNQSFLKIFGSDWPTKDGTGVRDYIHVMDLAEGHLVALEHLFTNKPKIISLNIGSGEGTSVLDLVKSFEKANGIKIPYLFEERRKGDVPRIVADNSQALSLFSWSPKRNIESMCKDGWKWKLKNPNGYYKE